MRKENAADCTNKQKMPTGMETQAIQKTADKAKEQASVTESSQRASCEEDRKSENSTEEEKPAEEAQGKNSEAKREAEKTKVSSNNKQGKFNLRFFYLFFCLYAVHECASPSSTNPCSSLS